VEPIAPAVEKILVGTLRKAPASEAPLLAWPVACGATVASRTRALEFSRGVLRVEVPDSAWLAELQHLAPRYIAVLNRYVTGVSRIEFLSRKADNYAGVKTG
jgi:Dna[CI] antecedent, DciA